MILNEILSEIIREHLTQNGMHWHINTTYISFDPVLIDLVPDKEYPYISIPLDSLEFYLSMEYDAISYNLQDPEALDRLITDIKKLLTSYPSATAVNDGHY